MKTKFRIWVDISTPPQLLFLRPIMDELERRGHELLITTRHSTETVPLAEHYGLKHSAIGAHGGASMVGKSSAIVSRALRLARFVRRHRIGLAVGHGSYSQALAAFLLRTPFATFEDYEGHPALHILCRAAHKIIVPEQFENSNLYKYGAIESKIESYAGIKEDVYLANYEGDPEFLSSAGIPEDKILVTMRPPSLVAAYHQFENPLFDEVLFRIASNPDVVVVLLPREQNQRKKYSALKLPNVIMPSEVLDGPNLVFHSDLVVGGGGTMNREATAVGTPAYTVFKGQLGSVDQYLIKSGRMKRIETKDDIDKIMIRKKTRELKSNGSNTKHDLISDLVNRALSVTISRQSRTKSKA